MKIHFYKSDTVAGWLIRLLTFSNWNHVSIEIDGTVYEALALKGVIKTPTHLYNRKDTRATIGVEMADRHATLKFLDDQVGKKYDWMALVALPFRTTWQSPHKWFCSELATKALSCAGRHFTFPSYRVTPGHLYFGLSEIQPKVVQP